MPPEPKSLKRGRFFLKNVDALVHCKKGNGAIWQISNKQQKEEEKKKDLYALGSAILTRPQAAASRGRR